MIGYLKGKVLFVSANAVVLDVNGVGYEILVSPPVLQKQHPGALCEFFIFTHLRADGRSESSLELFGFPTLLDKTVFLLLTSVSGVGYKTALAALSERTGESVLRALARQDRVALTGLPGIGKKTAERMVLEISEKARDLLLDLPVAPSTGARSDDGGLRTQEAGAQASQKESGSNREDLDRSWDEARVALMGLGYREHECQKAMQEVIQEEGDVTLEVLVRKSLQRLGRGRALFS